MKKLLLILISTLLFSCSSDNKIKVVSKPVNGHYLMISIDNEGEYDVGFRRAFKIDGERGEIFRKYNFEGEKKIEGTNFSCRKKRIGVVEFNNGFISIMGSPDFSYKITDYGFYVVLINETYQYHYLGDLMTPAEEIYLQERLIEKNIQLKQ